VVKRGKPEELFANVAVAFVDMAGSTSFKIDKQGQPDEWISRLEQFIDHVSAQVRETGGEVVKYIGDEVMALFRGTSPAGSALKLAERIGAMQEHLSKATGVSTKLKVAVDAGDAYLLRLEGHAVPDSQGTMVDRCARIARYADPGTVLFSAQFVTACGDGKWAKIEPPVVMKGLGRVSIRQLGQATVHIPQTQKHTGNLYWAGSDLMSTIVSLVHFACFREQDVIDKLTQARHHIIEMGLHDPQYERWIARVLEQAESKAGQAWSGGDREKMAEDIHDLHGQIGHLAEVEQAGFRPNPH
jgi:class 3 adenylate cyclase